MDTRKFLVIAAIGMAACSAPGSSPTGTNVVATAIQWPPAAVRVSLLAPLLTTQRVLSIAMDYQDHRLSCEAAALKMALAYEGIRIDELALISYMGDDMRPARVDASGRLVAWGDPNQAFVGNPDGSIKSHTGYGVYYAPVARAAVRAGAHVMRAGSGLYGTGVGPADLYNAILYGHPVVAWISNTYHDVRLSRYTAFDGATVWYTTTEHAVTLIGVRPDAVLINDPWFGRSWRPKAQFESAYRTFNDMAVVVG